MLISIQEVKRNKELMIIIFILIFLIGNVGLSRIKSNEDTLSPVNSPRTTNTTLKIVATLSIIEDVVEHIIGQDVPVTVPGTADPHSFEPTTSEILALENANIIFRMGLEDLEPWWRSDWDDAVVIDLIDSSMLIEDPLLGFVNPHVWMDPNNMKYFATEVNNTLWIYEPLTSNKLIFSNNTLNYLMSLDKLLTEIYIAKASFNGLKVVVNHPAYFYLFQESLLNITRLASIEKGEDQEPSAIEIAAIVKIMIEEDCHLIVTDPQHRTENVYEIARETQSKIALLTPLLNVEVTWNGNQVLISNYTQLIQYDLWALSNPTNPPNLIDIWWIIFIFGPIIIAFLVLFLYMRRRK
jgi:ABC-type Zn uptake system ZnuABC Zn-binding protein ZnuA